MEFLRKIALELAEKHPDPGKLAVVTPNRRAGLFLKKYIQENSEQKKPVWLPQVFSIEDFVSRVSELELPDRFSLMFSLYGVYTRSIKNPKPFDAFYSLSGMILADFDEIDKYLVDTDKLFKHLSAALETESIGETGGMIKDFSLFAGSLSELYEGFTRELLGKNQATYGLALRTLTEHFDIGRFGRWNRILFAGFYALTRAEQRLIELLTEQDKAEIYWDIDRAYFEDTKQEAGHSLRENSLIKKSETVSWISNHLKSDVREISIIGTAGRAAQAKVLGELLKKEGFPENETAVVLPDESLLFPVLHSVPETVKHINVTMGYPLKNTSLYRLVSSLISLHAGRTADQDAKFHFRDVERVLMHPFILPMSGTEIREFLKDAKEDNRVLLEPAELKGFDERVIFIFEPVTSAEDFIVYIRKILRDAVGRMKDDAHFSPEIESIVQFYTSLQRIGDLISEHGIRLEPATFWKFLKEIAETESVPFSGEPLQGLQIMGLLETRTLDFRNVYILSVNEGIIPRGKSQNSFIPNDVRKAFGMETWVHKDSTFAYHFYRLLQRAEKVRIFYNTVHDAFGKGEKSRFIDQIIHEFPTLYPRSVIEHRIVNIRPVFGRPEALVVEKDDSIIQKMKAMTFSPTRLQTYIDCSLKFYLHYLCGLDEQEELIESADARVMGSVIHRVLSRLFMPLKGKPLTREDLDQCRGKTGAVIREVFREEMGNSTDMERGRNFLSIRIIETLVGHFLNGEQAGKTILETEKAFHKTLKLDDFHIKLYGLADRIEKNGEFTDIIDFKTGSTGSLDFNIILERTTDLLLDELRSKNQVLQLLFYFVLAADDYRMPGDARFRLGLYSFRDQRETGQVKFLKSGKPFLTRADGTGAAEAVLRQVFGNVFDPGKPFSQTEDAKKCEYCPFTEVCGR